MINIVLYRPEKPQNTGNIMRTCVATHSVLHIIGPLSFSIDSKDLKRVGMDYIDDLKMRYYDSYEEFEKEHRNDDIYYVTRYADRVYSSYDLSDPAKDIYIMFGRESAGIPEEILVQHPEDCIRIPMLPEERSLNLSNSAAIILYEALRQLDFLNLESEGNLHHLSW